jgi:trimethylamine--corrinoid protein Co-methyltransferase
MLRGTRKPIVVSSPLGGETLPAMHAMAAACGEAGSFACLAMSSPPLQLDDALAAHLDLIRWYGLPSWHYAGHSDSKGLDEQWALELGIATILGALSRATLLHDVGYLESGMQSALEGLVLGDEVAGYARALLTELPVDDEALALAEVEAAGPGGTHLGTRMTRRRFRDFWRATLIDQTTYERWSAAGALTLLERVRARLEEIRAAGPAFELDDETERRIDALATGRRA